MGVFLWVGCVRGWVYMFIWWGVLEGWECIGKEGEEKLHHYIIFVTLKGLAMIFAGQENPFIIFRSKEIYIYFKTNDKIPINLLK